MKDKVNILGVGFTINSEDEILKLIRTELVKRKSVRKKIVIFTPNPEQLSASKSSKHIRDILNQAQISLPDGVGIIWAAKLLGKPIHARITGIDFMKKLVKSVAERPVTTGFFGGQEGVAEHTADCLRKKWPKLKVGYASNVYDKKKMIESDTDILFVALGFPKQEEWILAHKDEVPASIIMVVGGAFDFISGKIPRAPKLIRQVGLEWLFRLILQPWRIFRQARIWHFGALILLEALSRRLKMNNQ